jgi:hypothetical protein
MSDPKRRRLEAMLKEYSGDLPDDIYRELVESIREKDVEMECAMCIGPVSLPVGPIPCKHFQCLVCAAKTLVVRGDAKPKCPTCRKSVTSIELPVPSSLHYKTCHPNGLGVEEQSTLDLFRGVFNITGLRSCITPHLPATCTIARFSKVGNILVDGDETAAHELIDSHKIFTSKKAKYVKVKAEMEGARDKFNRLKRGFQL